MCLMHWCSGTISAYLLSQASTAGKVWSYLMYVCVRALVERQSVELSHVCLRQSSGPKAKCGAISCMSASELWSTGKVWSYLMYVSSSELWSKGKVWGYLMYVSTSELWSTGKVWSYLMYVSASELWSARDFRNPPVPAIRTVCVSLYRGTPAVGPEMTTSFIKRGGQHFFSYGCNVSDHCCCCGSLKLIFRAGSQPA